MDIIARAKEIGFTEVTEFDPKILVARDDVRKMCEDNKCFAYGHNWTCPPYCGTIPECQDAMQGYQKGIIIETTGILRKSIDVRGYKETNDKHNENTYKLADELFDNNIDCLVLGAGGCRRCKHCAHPAPCVNPDRAISSMEAHGLLISQVCKDIGIPYYHGEKTITYFSCILYNE